MIDSLFYVMLTELVVGGGGRTFAMGPVTLRMLIFAASLLVWIGASLGTVGRRDGQGIALFLVATFFVSLIPGLTVDLARGSELSSVSAELQPLLFILSAPFIAMAIKNVEMVRRSSAIIIYGGLIVAATTILMMASIYFGIFGFLRLYIWSSDSGELFFRTSSTFFYKGHFFVALSIIFCVVLRPIFWKSMCFILVVSLVLSMTRGLYLAVIVSIGLSFVTTRRTFAIFITVMAGLFITILYGNFIVDVVFDPNRNVSMEVRSRDIAYFMANFDYNTILLGDGAGTLLNGRKGIENSFLWSLWRFGLLGLIFWIAPFFISLKYFKKIPFGDKNHQIASAFFYGVVMLYVVTIFNPFINNSIGLLYLITAIFALRRLSRNVGATVETSAP